MLAVLAFVWHRVQPPWWDDAGDVAEMLDNQQNGTGYEGIDEYVPNGADVYEIKNDARRVTFEGKGSARIRITQWGPESKAFSANREPARQAGAQTVQLSGVEGRGENRPVPPGRSKSPVKWSFR